VIAPARLAAYDVLSAVGRGSTDLGAVLARARSSLRDERDRALAGEIAAGTLRWQGAFDHIITAFAGRPTSRLDPEVLTILRLSVFQLLHLDRIPASAAVDDAVQMTRKAGKRSAAPFVNALLRRVSRERQRLPLPHRPSELDAREAWLMYLSITLSHPHWLVERWSLRHGFEAAESWARFNNAPAPLTLAVNTLRATREEVQAALLAHGVVTEATLRAAHGLIVRDGNPLATPLAHDGRFFVQDEASQLVAEAVDARPGERVLDACASPGNKTTAMAAAMRDTGVVVASDVRPRRMRLLARTVGESGARSIRLVQLDASRPLPFSDVFDAVLVDAPCSGLGTIRRDPDIKWRRSPDEFTVLAARQLDILRATARVVRPGGRLVYSTCSSELEENDEVVEAFLAEQPGFRLAAVPLRTLPFRDGLEAFYAARLVNTAGPAVHS
jgi:16S rRNA (cytosine967-C5)-methyltransferase